MSVSKRCHTTDERNVVLDHDGVLNETTLAKIFGFGDRAVWLAKSQIVYEDDTVVEVPRWLADKKGVL